MATSTICKGGLLYRDKKVTFFGVEGEPNNSILERIERELQEYDESRLSRMSQVHVGPKNAGALFYAGAFSAEDLKRAQPREDRILIPNAKIGEHSVDIVVKRYFGDAISYTNSIGFEIGLF